MGQLVELTLAFDEDLDGALKGRYPTITGYRLLAKSLDARGANVGVRPRYHYRVELLFEERDGKKSWGPPEYAKSFKRPPVIVGAGPAGLFCALYLAESGIKPIVLERGNGARERMVKIARFWRYGELDEQSNVCYGIGGAGLFSDGKLITRIKSPWIPYIMQKLVEFGAPKETAWLANPHLGSNKIRGIIAQLIDYLTSKGVVIAQNSLVTKINFNSANEVQAVELLGGRTIETDHVVLAHGHSALALTRQLAAQKVAMAAKDFAVGVRMEHPRRHIDRIQLGRWASDERAQKIMGAATYRLSSHDGKSDTGRYSFCMCPGGYVLSSGTQRPGIVTNGMSNFARNSPWSNAAIVVTVKAFKDFSPGEDQLGGFLFQRELEKKAYEMSKKGATGREVPAQNLVDFLEDRKSQKLNNSSCPSGIFSSSMHELFSPEIVMHLKKCLTDFEKKLPGLLMDKALLLAPETRTSCPVTILRNKGNLESQSHPGLFPCGEGAGYAGGITSAAADGINVAVAILKQLTAK